MNLKNKNIAEGMYVVNGKQVWKVIFWDSKYQNALLQFITKNGDKTNDYVIAVGYTLEGTEKEAFISWDDGKYFHANSNDEAYDVFMGWLVEGIKESKLTESSKPINEKNVKALVDELNKIIDEKIHFADAEAEEFTKKYGRLYNFKYRLEDDIIVVYDSEGTLDLFDEDSLARPYIEKLAKKNGWYIDPYSCSCDFTFGEV